jgi:hypothetical protein
VTITDPNVTALGNSVTAPASLVCPATGVRHTLIPLSAINQATGLATLNFSSTAAITYNLFRV